MKLQYVALLISVSLQSFAMEGPDVYNENTLRCVQSFDVAEPSELQETAKPNISVTYSNQDAFEHLINEKDRDLYLRRSYFNGTSEAKCYALLGLYFIKSASYEEVKKDFLRHEKEVVVNCRVRNLKPIDSPAAVVRLIESGGLSLCIHPKAD